MLSRTEHRPAAYVPLDTASLESSAFAIQQRIDSLADAIRNKHVDHVMWHYAYDVIVYDLTAPLDVRGIGAYRKKFERWFAAVAGPIHYELLDLDVSAGDTQGTSHSLCHISASRSGGGRLDYRVRVTSGWKKADDNWVIAHEHISMPTLM
jgi:ketosteroid isomerase-like protein